jgi:hypothetical protein
MPDLSAMMGMLGGMGRGRGGPGGPPDLSAMMGMLNGMGAPQASGDNDESDEEMEG